MQRKREFPECPECNVVESREMRWVEERFCFTRSDWPAIKFPAAQVSCVEVILPEKYVLL